MPKYGVVIREMFTLIMSIMEMLLPVDLPVRMLKMNGIVLDRKLLGL